MNTRDTHLLSPGPKRILSLDGGGVRGIVTLAFLENIEHDLRTLHGGKESFRLCDHYDLIGGTSTGAIIASALALGFSVAEVKQFYLDLAPRIFRRSFTRILGVQSKFHSRGLEAKLAEVLGERTMDSDDVKTGLAIVCKRLDTGSPWVLSNHPNGAFWNSPADGSFTGNRHFLIRQLVRASTAAPYYFAPERIQLAEDGTQGLFIDGGMSPHNNPSLQLLMLATMKGYGFQWKTGADQLHITSLGTGGYRHRVKSADVRSSALPFAINALQSLASDSQRLTLAVMQWMSDPAAAWKIDSEIGDLQGEFLSGTPLFTYERHDLVLEKDWLASEADASVSDKTLAVLRGLDRPAAMPQLYDIASAYARKRFAPATLHPLSRTG